MVFILSSLLWIRIRGLSKLPDGRDWLWRKLGLVLMGRAMLSKSLIQFSVDGPDCVSSLLFDLRPNYGGGNEDNGDLLQKAPCTHWHTQCPWPCSMPPVAHASTRDSWTVTRKSGPVSSGVTAPFFWVLVHTRFCLCPSSVSGGYEFDFKCDCTLLVVASPLSLEGGYLFLMGSNILPLLAVQQLVAILVFSQEKINARPFTLPS